MKVLKYFLIGFSVMAFSTQVIAHTKLKESSPMDGSVIYSSPKELNLVFDGKVKLMKVDLRTKSGNKVKLSFKLSQISSESFSVPLPPLAEDGYVVHWIAMGKDSHKMKGKFSFEILSEERIQSDRKR
ncbi:MAG: copper resistance protein CopC [Kangiellaceae bacterium]|nr:copper resistance protein CopC [Kangiellaceae bacterium]MCW8999516.1 copper resistance protein CopC [Kangiellaceae bacterium]